MTIIPISKSDKDITKKEYYRPISVINIDGKNLQQNTSNLNPTIHKKDCTL